MIIVMIFTEKRQWPQASDYEALQCQSQLRRVLVPELFGCFKTPQQDYCVSHRCDVITVTLIMIHILFNQWRSSVFLFLSALPDSDH